MRKATKGLRGCQRFFNIDLYINKSGLHFE